ncbi:MAG TPA: gamma carbonic anhydrase family protein [Egibacteraceae bacterium]|nr:gamma carbonic anhydrase family protein [Egibacteraceae bacterium]
MPLFAFEGKAPEVHATAFVAPTATLVGEVVVEEGASVWYGAVIRADYAPVYVRKGANVQDGAVLHAPPNHPTEIGAGATVAHNCVVHGATVGEEALVANGAIVLDGATVGRQALVAAGAIVTAGSSIGERMLAMGAPAKEKGPIDGTPAEFWVSLNPAGYQDLARRHREGVTPIPEG